MTLRPALAADPAALVRPVARVRTVAELLDCDESDVRRMVADGTLEAHSYGIRGIRIYLDSVRAYQESRQIVPKAPKAKLRSARAAAARAVYSASEDALRKSGILP